MKLTKLQPGVLFGIIIVLAFIVRLHHFTYPIADWHSWRQADTSAVSRNFVKFGFDVLHPRFDDLSNVASGLDNPQGYRFVEFPIYNLFQAGLYSIFGIFSIEQWGRLVTIFASLGSLTFIYLLLKKYASIEAGLIGAFFFAFLPYSVYYGRVILPDPMMAAAVLGGIYFFDRWISETTSKKDKKSSTIRRNSMLFYSLALVFTTAAFLLKPYAVFFVIPMVYLLWNAWGIRALLKWQLWLFGIVSILPLIGWRMWMTQYPEGIPANTWLLNGNGIRFRPAFFRWLGYERLTKLISGYFGVLLLVAGGLSLLKQKNRWFFLSFVLGSLLYVVIFATGNVQHDYYQILVLPTIAMFYGLGGAYLVRDFQIGKKFHLGVLLLVAVTGLSLYFSWEQVKGYYYINNPGMVEAGRVVAQKTPPDAKVIALYVGDTSFLYQTERQGWASFQNPLPEMIEKGATHLVQLDPTPGDITLYQSEYTIVASTSGYVLVKLR